MSELFVLLARAFIGWGLLFERCADWCITQGYKDIDL